MGEKEGAGEHEATGGGGGSHGRDQSWGGAAGVREDEGGRLGHAARAGSARLGKPAPQEAREGTAASVSVTPWA